MRIYISVPISGRDLKEVEEQIKSTQDTFAKLGHEAVSPLEVNANNLNAPYSELLINDFKALLECDAIYLSKGWDKSAGCKAEFFIATLFGKPTTTLSGEPRPYIKCIFQKKEKRDWGLIALLIVNSLMLIANLTLLIIG